MEIYTIGFAKKSAEAFFGALRKALQLMFLLKNNIISFSRAFG